MKVQWRKTHTENVQLSLTKYLNPTFGEKEVGRITKADILNFRSTLAKVTGRKGEGLSASRVNHIMTPLRMILNGKVALGGAQIRILEAPERVPGVVTGCPKQGVAI